MKNPDRELAKLELKLRKIGSRLIHARRASWQQQNAGEKMLDAARLAQEASEAITARALSIMEMDQCEADFRNSFLAIWCKPERWQKHECACGVSAPDELEMYLLRASARKDQANAKSA